jgi:lysine-N-methylase
MPFDLRQPHYADNFRCIGSACEESCCQGWATYVDKATYKKYRATPSLRRAAAEHIERYVEARDNFRFARIKFTAEGRCPFLTPNKLCSIQQEHGAEFLSQTCSRYPRALVCFEGSLQKGLYLSCPEAAKLVLLSPELLPKRDAQPYREFTSQPTKLEVIKDGSPGGNGLNRAVRGFALDLLQDQTYPLWQRLFVVGIVCRRVTELTTAREESEVGQLLSNYARMILEDGLRSHLDGIPARPALQLDLVFQLIQRRFQIEQPHEAFAVAVADFLRAIRPSDQTPLPEAASRYQEAYIRFYRPFAEAFPEFMENYLLNYVFRTRFPLADTPDQVQRSIDPLASYLLLVLHYRLLHSLLIGAAACHGSAFSAAHAIRVVHSFARAVEHNVRFFDELLSCARAPDLRHSDGLAVLLRN